MKLKAIPKIKSEMTPFPYSIDLGQRTEAATRMMADHGIRHLPVTDGEDLVGVLSERDIKRAELTLRRLGEGADLRVRDACVLEAYVVDLNERLDGVLMEMAHRHIGSALVTRAGKLAGIFTTTDACRSYAELLRSAFPRGGSDEAA